MTGWVPKGEHALGQRLTNCAVHGLGADPLHEGKDNPRR